MMNRLNMTEFELKGVVAKNNILFCVYRKSIWGEDDVPRLGDHKVLDKITNDIKEAFKWAMEDKLEVLEERFEGRCNNGEGAWLHRSTIEYECDLEFLSDEDLLERIADYEHQAELEEHHG